MKKRKILLAIIISISLIVLTLIYLNINNISEKLENNKNETISEITNEVTDENINYGETQQDNNNYIFLYDGFELEKKVGIHYPDYMEITDQNNIKYNIDYYNYSDNEFIGVSKGNFGEEIAYENYSFVDNVEEIAISKKLNLIPRKASIIDEIPKELTSDNKLVETTVAKIDLDGDNKFEYITVNTQEYDVDLSEQAIQPGIMECSSSVILYNENFEKISTLITINDDYADSYKYLTYINEIDFLDIDNDGIIEILIEFPVWEGPAGVSIYKYNNGKIEGNTEFVTSITP